MHIKVTSNNNEMHIVYVSLTSKYGSPLLLATYTGILLVCIAS